MRKRKYLSDTIGKAAMLEQAAEEAAEFAKACLKMARSIRAENPLSAKYTEYSKQKMQQNLAEEAADILICMEELQHTGLLDEDIVKMLRRDKIKQCMSRFDTKQAEK